MIDSKFVIIPIKVIERLWVFEHCLIEFYFEKNFVSSLQLLISILISQNIEGCIFIKFIQFFSRYILISLMRLKWLMWSIYKRIIESLQDNVAGLERFTNKKVFEMLESVVTLTVVIIWMKLTSSTLFTQHTTKILFSLASYVSLLHFTIFHSREPPP